MLEASSDRGWCMLVETKPERACRLRGNPIWRRKELLARYECRRGREVVGNSASFASVLVDSASMFIVSRIQLRFEFVVEKLWSS